MSRMVRKQLFSALDTLREAAEMLDKLMNAGAGEDVDSLLAECQECAIGIGTRIEECYGEGTDSVRALEEYCELIYLLSEQWSNTAERARIYGQIKEQTAAIGNHVERELPDRLEMVFLPYQASMWDSLESVYLEAARDPDCDAYVIPIPYFDKNPDRSLGEMHYEGSEYPEGITVTDWQEYDFAKRCPDVIFIHNPYDGANRVTTVHPFFYSENLKQFTDKLVYIPYYTTSGGMGEARKNSPAYYHADYIVIQSEKYREFFDPKLPDEKFLPLGNPKFDRVIRACENPPMVPDEWKEQIKDRKVYFYNTSIAGMLADTVAFLQKMKYVFETFAGREDACLLWRPHPLLESTLLSMRPEFKPVYDALKNYFQVAKLGIYDDTSDVTRAIALSDAYIGDSSSSVVSLFGVAGKEIFILNNAIHSEPQGDDWRGQVIQVPTVNGNHSWMITQGSKLYHAPKGDWKFTYFCDLSEYAGSDLYQNVMTVGGKNYVCPRCAQELIELNETGIERRIELVRKTDKWGAFYGTASCGKYLFLIPDCYPDIVRYNTETGEISYIALQQDIHRKSMNGARRRGGYCAHKGKLYLASPIDNQVLIQDADTGNMQTTRLQTGAKGGYFRIASKGDDLWFLPYEGSVILRWNPETGEVREYTDMPEGWDCPDRPFGLPVFSGRYVYFPPCFSDGYVRLDKETGEMNRWEPPFEKMLQTKNGYYGYRAKAHFVDDCLFSACDRRLYRVNPENGEYTEIEITFDREEVMAHEPGFGELSEWLPYACQENAFNSLANFLNGDITGEAYDRKRQMKAYSIIANNHDGSCGEKVYAYLKEQIDRR